MYCSYGDIIMKSENSSAQEIECLRSLASMDDTFLRQNVSKQRQSKMKDFFKNFYAPPFSPYMSSCSVSSYMPASPISPYTSPSSVSSYMPPYPSLHIILLYGWLIPRAVIGQFQVRK